MNKQVYTELALMMNARQNCQKSGNTEWFQNHTDSIRDLVERYMPRVFDTGTTLDLDASTDEKLVFHFGYHHMNENGFYDGWTKHTCTVKPSLGFGISLIISGRNRNDIKDYLHDVYHTALTQDVVSADNKVA